MEQEIQDGLLSHATHRDHNEAVNLPKSLFLKISKTRSGRVVRRKDQSGRSKNSRWRKVRLLSCTAKFVSFTSWFSPTINLATYPPWNLSRDPATMS
jgi:hypothetical protein